MPTVLPLSSVSSGKLPEPLALPHELVGLRDAAGQRDHQPDGDFGHRIVEHVGRIGDADIPRPRAAAVSIAVIADAEIGDDFELGQLVHQLAARPCGRQCARTRSPTSRDQRVLIGGLMQLVDGVTRGQRLFARCQQVCSSAGFRRSCTFLSGAAALLAACRTLRNTCTQCASQWVSRY